MTNTKANRVTFPTAFRAGAERDAVRALRMDQQAYFSEGGPCADGLLPHAADAFDAIARDLPASQRHPLSATAVLEAMWPHLPPEERTEPAMRACLTFVREELLWLAAEADKLVTQGARRALRALERARSGRVVTDAAVDALFFGDLADPEPT
jgi:hypothetical protein